MSDVGVTNCERGGVLSIYIRASGVVHLTRHFIADEVKPHVLNKGRRLSSRLQIDFLEDFFNLQTN